MIKLNPVKIIIFSLLLSVILIGMAFPQQYIPGQTYYGRNNYVVYYAGDLAIIFSAPHGGSLTPSEIPDRTYGTTVTDSYTKETALAIRDAIFDSTGHYPHIIISNLKRTKLDPNREITEAAQGNQWAEQAWNEYHGFIDLAKDSITAQYGKGFYVDIHGHGHTIKRLELGYLISKTDLFKSNAQLNTTGFINSSSVRALATNSPLQFSDLIRGDKSLGALFEEAEIQAVPSLNQQNPGDGNKYFSGGYSTQRHGSRDGGTIDGVQIEAYYAGLRDTKENRAKYARAITTVFNQFFRLHYGWDGLVTGLEDNSPGVVQKIYLGQNYPNPFNPKTIIEYSIPKTNRVKITVYNLLGETIAVLLNDVKAPGRHKVSWNANQIASGLYIYKIESGGLQLSKKLILLK